MIENFVVGNWKMNMNMVEIKNFFDELEKENINIKMGIAVPSVYIEYVKRIAPRNVLIGSQNVHFEENGAYTGEISIDMLKDIKADFTLIGHSERRKYFNDNDAVINKKIKACKEKNMKVIFCIGEKLEERENGKTDLVIREQLIKGLNEVKNLEDIVIAYEPIWAIGTGETATPAEANEVCAMIREFVKDNYGPGEASNIIIQYGGSVKPENAKEILGQADINGVLVGGAALKATNLAEIIKNS